MGQYYNVVVGTEDPNEPLKGYDRTVAMSDYIGAKLTEHSWWQNEFVNYIASLLSTPKRIAWVGDYSEEVCPPELYNCAWYSDEYEIAYPTSFTCDKKYLVNHTTGEYLNLEGYKAWSKSAFGVLHPLPLLTAFGNGNGGGDYRGTNQDLVGMWAWDLLSISDTEPIDKEMVSLSFIED